MNFKYNFGSLVIDGNYYNKDLIILGDTIHPNWFRKHGHLLLLEDLELITNFQPEVVVIGSGYSGILKVSQEVKDHFQDKGIVLIVEPTGKALNTFKEISLSQKAAGAFHLTC